MTSMNMTVYPMYSSKIHLTTLELSSANTYLAFIFGTIAYLIIIFCNTVVLSVIAINKDLHKPMYILLFNMPLNDLMGVTAFFPQMLFSFVSQNVFLSHIACILQGFFIHLYGAGALLILTVMAYDRYVAICKPLMYHSIFSSSYLAKLIGLMWTVDAILILILFLLLSRMQLCRRDIVDPFCNNAALVRLCCGDIRLNNYYGLFITAFFQGLSISVVIFTYLQIFIACVSSSNKSNARSKAIQTCGTHLLAFLIFESSIMFNVITYRIQGLNQGLRRFFAVMMVSFPPFVNPLIYGLKTKEIKDKIILLFSAAKQS